MAWSDPLDICTDWSDQMHHVTARHDQSPVNWVFLGYEKAATLFSFGETFTIWSRMLVTGHLHIWRWNDLLINNPKYNDYIVKLRFDMALIGQVLPIVKPFRLLALCVNRTSGPDSTFPLIVTTERLKDNDSERGREGERWKPAANSCYVRCQQLFQHASPSWFQRITHKARSIFWICSDQ